MRLRQDNGSWRKWLTAAIAPCLLAWVANGLHAKGPRDEAPRDEAPRDEGRRGERPRDEGRRTVEGKVERMTTAPNGEVDGAVLVDGTVLHWPPHLADRFAEVVKPGALVKVEGDQRRGPEGDSRLEVRKLTNTETDAAVENDEPERGRKHRKGPPPRREEPSETAQGKVERLTTAPRGEVDGAVLEDGTVLHWPPHLEDRFADVVKEGSRVKATGFNETTRKGDKHFEVSSLTNLDTDKTVANDDRREAEPRPPRERGPRDENHDRDRDARERDRGPRGEDRNHELREIKKELERLLRRVEQLERDR
ncbi:MAG TPA: hypothetical protein VF278_24500 [Pirellulales bacterium]